MMFLSLRSVARCAQEQGAKQYQQPPNAMTRRRSLAYRCFGGFLCHTYESAYASGVHFGSAVTRKYRVDLRRFLRNLACVHRIDAVNPELTVQSDEDMRELAVRYLPLAALVHLAASGVASRIAKPCGHGFPPPAIHKKPSPVARARPHFTKL